MNKIFLKRLAAAVLTAVLFCVCLGGCGESSPSAEPDGAVVRVGSLKGPTSMGLLFLMEEAAQGESEGSYEFRMATGADELLSLIVRGELDIALVPANAAAVLYARTDGDVSVIDINTLGVLYLVSGDTSVEKLSDLKGKTVYLTGQGTTPDYVLRYLLEVNGMSVSDCTLEYRSEAAEVAALLAQKPDAVGLLPQPFATAACIQNDALTEVLDLSEEWDEAQGEGGSRLVTGVTVVRNDFLREHEAAVRTFLGEHERSAEAVNQDPDTGADYAVSAGIVNGAEMARKAIPKCSITCLTGQEMEQALSGYLEVLYGMDPESVGGDLPGEDFYYVP